MNQTSSCLQNFCSFSTHLSMKFILLINFKMPTIVGILTFICRINTPSESILQEQFVILQGFDDTDDFIK